MSLTENSQFTFTIGRLVAILVSVVGLSFTVGMSYQSIMPDRALQEKQSEEIQDIKVTMAKVTTILENMQEEQKSAKRDILALQEKAHVMNSEIQIVSSMLKEKQKKR